MSYEEKEGHAGRNQTGVPSGEEHGMGTFDDPKCAAETGPRQPSFKPEQLAAYRGTGHELIPLHVPDALDPKGRKIGKAPFKGWLKDAHLSVDEAQTHMAEGGNVGVRLRPNDLVVDVDPRNFPEGDDSYRRLQADLGLDFDDYPTVITGSGGLHVYMTVPDNTLLRDSLEAYQGVEFKTHGRQVVSAGSVHPDSHKPYEWDVLAPPLSRPKAAPSSLVELTRRPGRIAAVDAGDRTPEQLGDMLEGLDPVAYRDQTKWLELMMACHHATAGDGRDEWIEWSTTDPRYSKDAWIIGRRWDSLHSDSTGRRITEKTLFKALIDAGQGDLVPRTPPEEDFPDEPDWNQPSYELAGSGHAALEKVNSTHFTVLTAQKYLVGRERRCPFTGHSMVEWFPDHAIQKHMDRGVVTLPEGARKPLGKWWLNNRGRRQYDGVLFDPTPGAVHPTEYNLWTGWAVDPVPGDWTCLKHLLRDVLCRGDEESYQYVLKWSAFMVQAPHVPAEVALVFKGSKGVGKGTFARWLKGLAGKHGKQVAQTEQFTGKFNEHLADTIMLFVDEGLWAGDRKAEGALKNLITEPTLTFEGKFKPLVSGPNRLHIVIASNEDWVIPASNDERRFAVFEADSAARTNLPSGFFAELDKEMNNGGLAGMLYELLAIDLTEWHPRAHVPTTRALVDQKLQGLRGDPIAFWWYRTLEDGTCHGVVSQLVWEEEGFDIGSGDKDLLLFSLESQARSMGRRAEYSKTAIASFLKLVGVDVAARDRKGGRTWRVPSLPVARASFNGWIGGGVNWETV